MSHNRKLSKFSDSELIAELTSRGYTILDPIEPLEFTSSEWSEPPTFDDFNFIQDNEK